MRGSRAVGSALNVILVGVLCLAALPFAIYATDRGLSFWDLSEQATSRFFAGQADISSAALYAHMVAGGIITALAPLQLLTVVRAGWPALHRMLGYLLFCMIVLTAFGGGIYIVFRGTIGGMPMNAGFGLYGALMLWAAIKTVHYARLSDTRHYLWAQRLVILVMASWLYRVHYGIWELATGGVGRTPEFTGAFDVIQSFAFYLPYLALHQLWWHRRQTRLGRG